MKYRRLKGEYFLARKLVGTKCNSKIVFWTISKITTLKNPSSQVWQILVSITRSIVKIKTNMPLCIKYIKSKKPKAVKCIGFILTICTCYWKKKKIRWKKSWKKKCKRSSKLRLLKNVCFSPFINLQNRHERKTFNLFTKESLQNVYNPYRKLLFVLINPRIPEFLLLYLILMP